MQIVQVYLGAQSPSRPLHGRNPQHLCVVDPTPLVVLLLPPIGALLRLVIGGTSRALINRPRVVLADEPTGALDSAIGNKIADLLLEIQRESGVTLVVVTHDQDLAQRVGGIFDLGN